MSSDHPVQDSCSEEDCGILKSNNKADNAELTLAEALSAHELELNPALDAVTTDEVEAAVVEAAVVEAAGARAPAQELELAWQSFNNHKKTVRVSSLAALKNSPGFK